MRLRRHWLLVPAVLAISACSLYYDGTEHTPHVTAPDAGISGHDSGCHGGDHDGGSFYPDAGYSEDGGSYGGNDGGVVWPVDAWPDGH